MFKLGRLADELKEEARADIQKRRIERYVVDNCPLVAMKIR